MDAIVWIMLPLLVAAGSAFLSFYLMQARLEVAVAKEQEASTIAETKLKAIEASIPDKIRAAEETARRKAFDEFLMEFRVEERHFVREKKSHFHHRKMMVMQERLFFRKIPLSNWVEHELQVGEGSDAVPLAENDFSVFSARPLAGQSPPLKYLAQ